MFRIGQLTSIYKVSTKTLRFYDEMGLCKPKYVDEATGYRYYTSSQIPVLNEIFLLKELGLSLKEIGFLVQCGERNESALIEILEYKKMKIKQEMEDLKEKKTLIEMLEFNIKDKGDTRFSFYKVGVKAVEETMVASIHTRIATYTTQEHLWTELLGYLNRKKVRLGSERYTIYYDSVYKADEMEVEIVKRVVEPFDGNERIECKKLPACEMVAYVLHTGEHRSAINSYEALFNWIETNGYEICGAIREKFHMDDFTVESPEDFVTEIQVPIKKLEKQVI